jgi:hypothetical protein
MLDTKRDFVRAEGEAESEAARPSTSADHSVARMDRIDRCDRRDRRR